MRLAKFNEGEHMPMKEAVMLKESDAMARYQLGRTTLRNKAKELNATIHVTPRCLRYRVDILDKAFFAGVEQ